MTTSSTTAPVFGAFTTLRHRLLERWRHERQRRARAAQVRRELEAYTARELADLGLSRADIPDLARAAYNGA